MKSGKIFVLFNSREKNDDDSLATNIKTLVTIGKENGMAMVLRNLCHRLLDIKMTHESQAMGKKMGCLCYVLLPPGI